MGPNIHGLDAYGLLLVLDIWVLLIWLYIYEHCRMHIRIAGLVSGLYYIQANIACQHCGPWQNFIMVWSDVEIIGKWRLNSWVWLMGVDLNPHK